MLRRYSLTTKKHRERDHRQSNVAKEIENRASANEMEIAKARAMPIQHVSERGTESEPVQESGTATAPVRIPNGTVIVRVPIANAETGLRATSFAHRERETDRTDPVHHLEIGSVRFEAESMLTADQVLLRSNDVTTIYDVKSNNCVEK